MPVNHLQPASPDGNLRIAIVAARFNAFVVDRLLAGAIEALRRHGVLEANIDVARVPGAFELPLAAQALADSDRYDAVIALGVVIRGDTPHFEYVCAECAGGLMRATLDSGVPIAFGVLTTENEAQALQRAGADIGSGDKGATAHADTLTGNKGADAALCALEMAGLLRTVAASDEQAAGRGDNA